uniref:Ubiquitin-like protease family profile domain-containing protein n=1 Tax=Noccaea caerulescens TaxID=107243 RepID=A0A1J3JHH1_NOCCA
MKRYKEVKAFSVMVPRIVKETQTNSKKKQILVAPYTVKYAHVRKDLNKSGSDCGIYALKHIECHVLGLNLFW